MLGVLWAHRTISCKLTRVTPYALAYDMEVLLLIKIDMPTTKSTISVTEDNYENMEMHLDWADKASELAFIQLSSYPTESNCLV